MSVKDNVMRKEQISKEDNKSGHRQRTIKKLIDLGPDVFYDYEILEMFLFIVIKRRDTKCIAKALLKKFGTVLNIFSALKEDLLQIDGIGESVYNAFQIVKATINLCLKDKIQKRSTLECFDNVVQYCQANMMHLRNEELRVIFLNLRSEVISDEVLQKGTIDKVGLYPREVVKKCIDKGASSVILVHNHPSGNPTPSSQDVYNTALIKEACDVFNIDLQDHIIIGNDQYVSFRQLNLL